MQPHSTQLLGKSKMIDTHTSAIYRTANINNLSVIILILLLDIVCSDSIVEAAIDSKRTTLTLLYTAAMTAVLILIPRVKQRWKY